MDAGGKIVIVASIVAACCWIRKAGVAVMEEETGGNGNEGTGVRQSDKGRAWWTV